MYIYIYIYIYICVCVCDMFVFSSYLGAIRCVQNLVRECPPSLHKMITEGFQIGENAEELSDLCRTNGLYEREYNTHSYKLGSLRQSSDSFSYR